MSRVIYQPQIGTVMRSPLAGPPWPGIGELAHTMAFSDSGTV